MSEKIADNRIADAAIYDNRDFFDTPKDYFRLALDEITARQGEPASLLDVGCANGAFLYHVGKAFLSCTLRGIEPVPKLAATAQINVPRAVISQASLGDHFPRQMRAETVTCMGVIGIFQDPELFLRTIISLLLDRGVALVFSPFNEEPIDVVLNYRHAPSGEWESGHNLFSMRTIEDICHRLDVTVEWKDFKLSHAIAKSEDPMRSWTEPFRDNEYHVVYGSNMFATLKLLILQKNNL
jgi:SAM-dependent methyltransferase